ncbi:pilus assembly protein [Devosia oryziradicis]|uniref:Pilus assembly protein n=1 Tax=Devosia oryziradicis TaxID=2801335 RepID=A0ABX7C0A3_9HYPH|nr:TadE/TadG family type IV pilus assembly protein [Devosia oryziradicis]QQR36085.1 pilus assembly protein [Devosia oryziradicis]
MKGVLAKMRLLRLGEAGTAAVEFALVLPVMLMLYIGSVEVTGLISVDRKLQSAAGSLGDLVARSDTTITAATLKDYFKAAGGIMTPNPVAGLRQVVTQVQVLADGTTKVVWSRQSLNGTYSTGPHAVNAAFPLPVAMVNIAKGKYVIVAEGYYDYTPLSGFAFNQTVNLYRENYFMPRFGGSITLN